MLDDVANEIAEADKAEIWDECYVIQELITNSHKINNPNEFGEMLEKIYTDRICKYIANTRKLLPDQNDFIDKLLVLISAEIDYFKQRQLANFKSIPVIL